MESHLNARKRGRAQVRVSDTAPGEYKISDKRRSGSPGRTRTDVLHVQRMHPGVDVAWNAIIVATETRKNEWWSRVAHSRK